MANWKCYGSGVEGSANAHLRSGHDVGVDLRCVMLEAHDLADWIKKFLLVIGNESLPGRQPLCRFNMMAQERHTILWTSYLARNIVIT